jgi:NAD(P)-dependent dehydrogenase (short-subunit alcohol dehydrogenase family)
MKQDHVTALVSGANRGLGRRIAAELLARGATVYGAARGRALDYTETSQSATIGK